jgi:hypothetical protein
MFLSRAWWLYRSIREVMIKELSGMEGPLKGL